MCLFFFRICLSFGGRVEYPGFIITNIMMQTQSPFWSVKGPKTHPIEQFYGPKSLIIGEF